MSTAVLPAVSLPVSLRTVRFCVCALVICALLSTLGFAGAALEADPKSARAAAFFLGAGVMAGVASSSKATGER